MRKTTGLVLLRHPCREAMTTAQEETCSTDTARRLVDVSLGGCGVAVTRLPVKHLILYV